jgi:hypothetical protein
VFVPSLRQNLLLHQQKGAAFRTSAGGAGSGSCAVGPVALSRAGFGGVCVAASREFSVRPSIFFIQPRSGTPSLSAELHLADLILPFPRP